MKKLTSILLGMALMCFVAVGVHAGNRTVDMQHFKTEITKQIVKETVKTVNYDHQVSTAIVRPEINPLALSELKRPPGLILAYADYARSNSYKNTDALIKPNLNYSKLRLCDNWRLNLRRTC